MLKKIIAPIQNWLLKRNVCVGCGMPLKKARKVKEKGKIKIFCKCQRIFIQEGDSYRRALFEEV